jgi:mitochondrial fission protein ELM1
MPTQSKPFIIALTDNKDGHKNQLLAVLQVLKQKYSFNQQILLSSSTRFGFLSICLSLVGINLLVNKSIRLWAKDFFYTDSKVKNIIILAVGKQTLAGCIYLKLLCLKFKINVKVIYLMPPTKIFKKYVDLSFFHNYKKKQTTDNQIGIIAPPNLVSLNLGQMDENSKASNKFIISVLIGGDAKNIVFNNKSVDNLLQYLNLAQKQLLEKGFKVEVLISTSRRTNPFVEQYLAEQINLSKLANYTLYGFNANSKLAKDNYIPMLKQANAVIVSGESVSMLSEACALPSSVGVYVFFNNSFFAKRYVGYHNALFSNNYAYGEDEFFKHIEAGLPLKRSVLNTTDFVANEVNNFISTSFSA